MVEIDTLTLNPNPLVRALGKQPHEFTRHDIIRFVAEQDIPMLNLRYLGGDGRLKVLNFAIQSSAHLNRILTMGERVDGSSLFNFVDATSSDLYVVPQLRTAFLNPFAEFPTLDIVCGFYDVEGNPLASSPQQILRKAQQALEDETGWSTTCSRPPRTCFPSSRSAATTRPARSRNVSRCVSSPWLIWCGWAAPSSMRTPRWATSSRTASRWCSRRSSFCPPTSPALPTR